LWKGLEESSPRLRLYTSMLKCSSICSKSLKQFLKFSLKHISEFCNVESFMRIYVHSSNDLLNLTS
jgi:hypothetical protein